MKSPRKIAIYKAKGMGKLRTGGIAKWIDNFEPSVKLLPDKKSKNRGGIK